MLWIRIKSKWANLALTVAGIVYAVAGATLLVWLTVDIWGAASRLDHLFQAMLAGIVALGLWMAANSLRNLGFRPGRARRHEPLTAS